MWDTVVDGGFLVYDTAKFLFNGTRAIEGQVSETFFNAIGRQDIAAVARADKQHYAAKIAPSAGNLGLSLAGTAIPGVPILGLKAVNKVENTTQATMTATHWAKVAFDAQKQQVDKLKGITDSSLRDAIKNLYRPKDSVPGGTAGAIHFTKQTKIPIGGSDHIIKGEGRLTQLQRITTNVVGQQLNLAKTEAKKLWRALTR